MPGETGGYGRAVIMNINRRMMVVMVVWVENGGDDEDGLGGERGGWKRWSQCRGAGDENDAGNPAFAVF